jgi:hypothetical protein
MGHQSSTQRLQSAARELNHEARFGRMTVAAQHTADTARSTFLERRTLWGNEIRVVDVQLANMVMEDENHAELIVQYAWTRMDEGVLRSTAIKQSWSQTKTGWKLDREQRASGDAGLFGEHAVNHYVESRGDVHFPSKSLGQRVVP